jgi:hypothetical protein
MAIVNGFETAAWSINGARHRGNLLRVVLFAGTSGAEGIINAADLKVTQNGAGTPQVNIATGAVVFRNRSAGAKSQSYAAMAPLVSSVDIATNGTGATRYDLVIVKAKDPEYPGFTLPGGSDPLTYQYVEPIVIQNVPAGTKDWAAYVTGLGTPYSAYALARIAVPPGASNITSTMITDLRKVAAPLRESKIETYFPVVPASSPHIQHATNGTRSQWGPDLATLEVPAWATQVKLIVTASQARYNGAMTGRVRAELGTLQTQDSGLQNDSGSSRTTVVCAGELAIPSNMRGTTQTVKLNSTRISLTGVLGLDEHSTIVIQATFVEVAE